MASHCLIGMLGGHVLSSPFIMCTEAFHESVGHCTIERLAREAFRKSDPGEAAVTMFEAARAAVAARGPRPAGRDIFAFDRGAAMALIRGRAE